MRYSEEEKENMLKILVNDILVFNQPTKQKDIIKQFYYFHDIKIVDARVIRRMLKKVNDAYIAGDIDYVIISDKHGSYKSRDITEIKNFNNAKIKHAKSELWSAYNMNRRITNDNTVSLYDLINEFEQKERT